MHSCIVYQEYIRDLQGYRRLWGFELDKRMALTVKDGSIKCNYMFTTAWTCHYCIASYNAGKIEHFHSAKASYKQFKLII